MMLRRPARSLWLFLGLVVAVGALFGHAWDGAALAAFFLFISSIDAKPAFKAQFDAPGSQDSGRGAGRFLSWRRVLPQSPHEQRRMPRLDDY
ncbi:MAG: hypothetical protein M3R37_05465 [Actinomycetota bacterium]|nr:hypothetical protein [Actinomycetota bacterium]